MTKEQKKAYPYREKTHPEREIGRIHLSNIDLPLIFGPPFKLGDLPLIANKKSNKLSDHIILLAEAG